MSVHQAFRRQPVPQQVALQAQSTTLAAPSRGIIESDNQAFMRPGSALVCDNWAPTMRGVRLRGGCKRWCDLHAAAVVPLWQNNKAYGSGGYKVRDGSDNTFWILGAIHTSAATGTFAADRALHPTYWVATLSPDIANWQRAHQYATTGERAHDVDDGSYWDVAVIHTSAVTGTFAADRAAHPTWWTLVSNARQPIISAFEYSSGSTNRMYAGEATALYDVTTSTAVLIKSGQTSGNYVASQFANSDANYMMVANEGGDYLLRFDGTTWITLNSSQITTNPAITPPPSCATGHNLTYVWKYRNRYFFIEGGTMNAWYLGINSIQGQLNIIPLAGAVTRGGYLMAGFTWSTDAGDGLDDKCVFWSSEGELIVFTGSNPGDAANWRQEGRFAVGKPMGMNAHIQVGGDVMLETVDGIVPMSSAISKDASQLDLAAVTTNIKSMWREEVNDRGNWPWSMKRWDEYGAMFIAWPGGAPGNRYCLIANTATGAFARFVGWDAMCFIRMGKRMFFGTQDGIVMEADIGGLDDGQPYIATLVGGWGALGSRLAQATWHQARASFTSLGNQPFIPQISAVTDYDLTLMSPPPVGEDFPLVGMWDGGTWDATLWDTPLPSGPSVKNTMWVSIGATGFIHAPVVQVAVGQKAKPLVELVAIDAIYTPMGANV